MNGKTTTSSSDWVILWVTCPLSNYMVLPRNVATILGCTREDLNKLRKPQRTIAFLARPAQTLRVVGMHRSAELVGRALGENEVVGTAQVMPINVMFNVPDAVEAHMGLETYRREGKGYVTTGTDDTVAWIMPASEYYPYRRAIREETPYVPPVGGAHVYFRKSLFPGLMPGVEELEKGSTPA